MSRTRRSPPQEGRHGAPAQEPARQRGPGHRCTAGRPPEAGTARGQAGCHRRAAASAGCELSEKETVFAADDLLDGALPGASISMQLDIGPSAPEAIASGAYEGTVSITLALK